MVFRNANLQQHNQTKSALYWETFIKRAMEQQPNRSCILVEQHPIIGYYDNTTRSGSYAVLLHVVAAGCMCMFYLEKESSS